MWLSLSHPHLCISPKTPASPSPPFLSPPTRNAALRSINPKPPRSSLRSSHSTPTANKTLANSAIQRISEKLRSLGYLEENPNKPADRPQTGPGSAGEIFIPTPQELAKHRVGYTIDSSWSTPEHPIPEPGTNIARFHALWRKGEREKARSKSVAPVPMVAELTIPAGELRRLRTVGIRLEKRLKVGKAGITEGIVNGIHERWRRSELVKIKCEDLCRMNMKRTHETLERKTGGLVVWRSGSIIILYRGANYIYPYFYEEDQRNESFDKISSDSEPSMDDGAACEESKIAGNPSESLKASSRSSLVIGVGSPKRVRLQLPGEVQLEEEVDRLLDGLGPRFSDWWGCDPLPIDADLLPAIVPGFRKPFRLLPFGVMPKLTDREMTILRRLGRPLPCHFALGRNRNLQGLAVSMVKLWEKCEIAKIAVKRGVQNTNSEMMAEELKQLTGGTLLSRDTEFIVFYRGKDFLPPAVSIAIQERRKSEMGKQEQSMAKNSSIASMRDLEPRFAIPASANEQEAIEEKSSLTKVNFVKRQASENLAVKRTESRLSRAIEKKEKAEMLLAELEKSVKPAIMESDREGISEEERYMLRKVGLRMKPFLLLGRRGVFDGTVENMHLHWKYRELVKIISNDRSIQHAYDAARTLESESGGILVAVERVSKGHAIIVYRGKNYRRPSHLRPKTLLNKKEAMKRSLEAQRRESLKLHVLSLTRKIDQLQHQRVIDNSPTDSVQLVQHDASDTTIETKKSDWSTEYSNISAECVHHQGNVKEVDEADAEFVHSNEHVLSSDTGETANVTTNDKLMASKHDFSKTEAVQSFSEPRNNTSISNYDVAYIADESMLHPEICLERAQVSCSPTNYISNVSDEESTDLSLKPTRRKPETCVHDKLGGEHNDELPFKASPLSNRERLILRKQALKMRKRPVLAVGRSNVITGVAKTIKTHFRKHPLAIVNIKGRANGTSVHELIFELEQATGAVLVSREPNKVILYRGWGEGEVPGGAKGKDAVKALSGTKERPVSPQLIAAIRRECGLEASQVE